MVAELTKEVLESHPASDATTYFSGLVFEISEQMLVNVQKMPI